MASFKDDQKRSWSIVVTIPLARKVRDQLGVDILKTQTALQELSEDPLMMIDVIYLLCEQQAEKRGVTDEQFGEALSGGSVHHAVEAFTEALINFTSPQRQKILRAMQSTAVELESLLTGMAEKKLPAALQAAREQVCGTSLPG